MQPWRNPLWPHDSNNQASGKPGAVHNLVEGFFSKLARSVLRHIRVSSKEELENRMLAAIDDLNQNPVVRTWPYKLNTAA